jgi:hypothetical protein
MPALLEQSGTGANWGGAVRVPVLRETVYGAEGITALNELTMVARFGD